jgi:hypothetical protein
MRRYGIFSLLSALVLLLLVTWLGPKYLVWWFQPPVPQPISCNEAVAWGMRKLVETQIYGLLLGIVGGALLAFFTRKKTTAQATLPPGNTSAASAASTGTSVDRK